MRTLPENIPDSVRSEILRINDALSVCPGVHTVYLYGSFAAGTFRADSDIDIAVFMEEGEACELNTYLHLNRRIGRSPFDVQLQVFSCDELEDPSGIVEEVVSNGMILFEQTTGR